jgi:hypothetical protein
MERVTFLIEATGERLGCLLNPNTLIMRRTAGVRPLAPSIGQLSGNGISDDPLLFTGGGRTELELDLLFDIGLAGSSITADDVRELTRPLWDLAENGPQTTGTSREPPVVRFVWGKAWNIPGVIAAIAERLEEFAPSGAAQRSWLRMRLIRVPETTATAQSTLMDPLDAEPMDDAFADVIQATGPGDQFYEVIGGGPDSEVAPDAEGTPPGTAERIDEIAARYYGDPAYWRLLALANDIDDPTELPAGDLIRIPALPAARRARRTARPKPDAPESSPETAPTSQATDAVEPSTTGAVPDAARPSTPDAPPGSTG